MLALELLICNVTCNLMALDALKYQSLSMAYTNIHNLYLAFETRAKGSLTAYAPSNVPFHRYLYDWIKREYKTSVDLFNKASRLKDKGYIGSALVYMINAFSRIYIVSKAFAFLKLKTATDVGKEVGSYGELVDSIIYSMYRTTVGGKCKNVNALLYMVALSEYSKLQKKLKTLMSPPDVIGVDYAKNLTEALGEVSRLLALAYTSFTLMRSGLSDVVLQSVNGTCIYPHAFAKDLKNDLLACRALNLRGNGFCNALKAGGCAPIAALAVRETFPSYSGIFCAVKS